MKLKAAYIISLLLILLFAYTASSKLLDPERFISVLKDAPLIGRGAGMMAILLPLAEFIIVLLLIFESTRLKGLYASVVLISLFTVYLGYMILFVPHLPCSCGGVISKMTWKQHLFFNAAFIVLTVVGIRSMKLTSVVRNHDSNDETIMRIKGEAENLDNRVGLFKNV